MEAGASNRWGPSFLQHKLCLIRAFSERLKCVGARWWKCVLLCVALASCASLLFISISRFPEFSSTVTSLLGSRGTKFVGGRNGHPARLLSVGRHLVAQEGDYETVPFIQKQDPESATLLGDVIKEAQDHALLQKVANGDQDYENVALYGKVTSDADVQVQLQDGIEREVEDPGVTVAADEQKNVEDYEPTEKDAKPEHSGVEKLLDRLEESVGNEEDGRFNKTISKQEGVLETVARVGGRSFDDEEDEEEPTQEEKEVMRMIDTEILGRSKEESSAGSQAGHSENSKELDVADVTWLDRIMGESEQSHPLVKESSKTAGKNHFVAPLKKNLTWENLGEDNAGYHQVEDVPRLIDREDNEYVISNPGKNRMILQEDLTLISDIVMVIVAAALGGTICGLLGQPVILGYLTAGMVVGPGGLHLVHELVQVPIVLVCLTVWAVLQIYLQLSPCYLPTNMVETLAQFGVVFLLFVLGVEFDPSKMKGIHNVTLGGGCLQISSAMILGGLLGSSIPQGVFIGAFLSMSSTAVVVKCLMDSNMGGTEHGKIMLGTLILQDCALGLLLAVMPALAAKGSDVGTFTVAISRAAVLLLIFSGSAWGLAKLVIPRFLHALVQLTRFNPELFLLGAIGVCLSLALISQSMGLSLEVGAFIGGLVLSGTAHTEKTLHQVEPIRNVFAALFLTSIGMVMHPGFLWEHIDILMVSLGVVFLGKTCLFAAVVRTFGYSGKTSVSVGIALAQIGEFAFILLSRAQGLGLVSKKLYLLLMGTSALSLVLTPFAFKIVVWFNPPGQPVFRKATSKPLHTHAIQARQDAAPGLLNTTRTDVVPSYWSPSSIGTTVDNQEGSKSGHMIRPSTLNRQDKHVESLDMEDGGRGDLPSSPARVVLRRPYHQVMSEKLYNWRDTPEA